MKGLQQFRAAFDNRTLVLYNPVRADTGGRLTGGVRAVTRLLGNGEPVQIWGADETPGGFIWQNTPHEILEITNRWRVHTRWWEPHKTVWREYLKVVTDSGLLCHIYHDLHRGGWFLSRIFD